MNTKKTHTVLQLWLICNYYRRLVIVNYRYTFTEHVSLKSGPYSSLLTILCCSHYTRVNKELTMNVSVLTGSSFSIVVIYYISGNVKKIVFIWTVSIHE